MSYQFTFNSEEHTITDKEKLFAMYYVENGFNAKQAAIAAGYSEKTATVQGSTILTRPNVRAYVEHLKANLAEHIGISAYQCAKELSHIAFADIRDYFDSEGNPLPLDKLTEKAARNLNSIEVEKLGDEKVVVVTKLKTNDKLVAMRDLIKLLGYKEVDKVATVDSKGNDVPQPKQSNFVVINAQDLTDAQLEKIVYGNSNKPNTSEGSTAEA